MFFKKILLATVFTVLITSCSTTEKFSVYAPNGTKIYIPDKTDTKKSITTNSNKTDIIVPSDRYYGYMLAQTTGSDLMIPIGIDYTISKHTGEQIAAYTGGAIWALGMGATIGGVVGILAADDDNPFTYVVAAGAAAGGIGALINMTADSRLDQIAYKYNFSYEKEQKITIPALSTTLLKPNSPKKQEKVISTSPRKKASSGTDSITTATSSSQVNKNRSDNAKKIEGLYKGTGTLSSMKKIDEKYSEISVIIKRIDKTHVSVRIIEDEEDYFESPLIYEVHINKNGAYLLNIEKLPEAVIQITKNGKMTFTHPKVNIDNQIYTLEIIGAKNKK